MKLYRNLVNVNVPGTIYFAKSLKFCNIFWILKRNRNGSYTAISYRETFQSEFLGNIVIPYNANLL